MSISSTTTIATERHLTLHEFLRLRYVAKSGRPRLTPVRSATTELEVRRITVETTKVRGQIVDISV